MGVKHRITRVGKAREVSLREAFDEFIAEKETQGLTEKTIRNYQMSYQYFIELEFDEEDTFNINELTKIFVQQWVDSMRKKKMRVTTINTYLRFIRAFLYWCMDDERKYIEEAYKIELVKGQEPLPKIFTDEEVEAVLQKPTNLDDFVEWRMWAICNWVVATGNRAATVCEITLGDLDFTNYKIALRHTKNKKAQFIDMAESLVPILKTYIKMWRYNEPNSAFLFPSYGDEQLTYNALRLAFSKYCHKRGVEKTNIHGLRHYFATRWVRGGGSGDKLKKILGHSTYTMTQRYIQLEDRDVSSDFDRYNPLNTIKTSTNHKRGIKRNANKG